ncbi:hypothetical protein [Actinoplanes sp. NPDC049599]|uniref:hypothetical protein n=1 Tax=Actinoplanes sp. NPDC049599 TaxID=3363903 RepID=UPI0037A9C080
MRRTFTLLALAGLGGAALVVLPRASASAVPDTTPALAATGAGTLSLVWRGSAPRRLQEQTATGDRWDDATAFAGARPAADTGGVGRGADPASGQILTATVADEQVWVRTEPGGRWSGLGGSATGAPAVAALGGGAFAVVVRDDEGTVHVRHLRDGAWGGWSSLGGGFTTSPAAVGRSGSLVIAVAGRKREVRTTVVTAGRPTGWRRTGVISTATPGLAAEPGTGTLHLITRNPDLSPSARASLDGARTWGRPTRLPGRLGSGIAATSRTPGTVDIAALGLDGRAVQSTLRSGRWGRFRLIAASGTTVLPEDAVTAVTGDPAATRSIHFAAHARLPEPGEILAATSTPATPDGLLVKVVSVTGRTARAAPATLTEAVPEGTLDETFALGTDTGPVSHPIRHAVPCSNGEKAEVSGMVTLTPSFHLEAAWHRPGGVTRTAFTATVTSDAQLKLSISDGATCTLKRTALLAEPIRFSPVVFPVGPVPVVITPQVQLHLDASGTVQAALETSAGQTATIRAGLTHRDGRARPVSGLRSTFTFGPPTISRSATARAGVAPTFSFLVYGVPGPRVTTRAAFGMAATAGRWELRTGLTAGVELVVPQLGIRASRPGIVRSTRTLATGGGTPPAGSGGSGGGVTPTGG